MQVLELVGDDAYAPIRHVHPSQLNYLYCDDCGELMEPLEAFVEHPMNPMSPPDEDEVLPPLHRPHLIHLACLELWLITEGMSYRVSEVEDLPQ